MSTREIRLFVASPGDVLPERDAVDEVVASLNEGSVQQSFDPGTAKLTVLRWERFSMPDLGRPQACIVEQAGAFDLFLAIFWCRCGTPTGVDEYGHQIAESGTVEEIAHAIDLRKKGVLKNPVMIYRCMRAIPQTMVGQFQRTQEFLESLDQDALITTYDSVADLKLLLLEHLPKAVQKVLTSDQESPHISTREQSQKRAREQPLPADLIVRSQLLERLKLCIATHGHCILVGATGTGKSTLASQYFKEFRGPKAWIPCRSLLAQPSGLVDIRDCKLVVLDHFEDRAFCWAVLTKIEHGMQVLVTTTDSSICARIRQRFGSMETTAEIEVGELDEQDWNRRLKDCCSGNYVQIFDHLRWRFGSSAAALRLLVAAITAQANPEKALTEFRVKLAAQAELADERELAAGQPRHAYRHEPAPFAAQVWWQAHPAAGSVMWLLSCVPLIGMSSETISHLLGDFLSDETVESELALLEQQAFVYPVEFGRECLWCPVDYLRSAFEAIELTVADTQALELLRRRYIKLAPRLGVLGRVDAIFSRAILAFESRKLPDTERELQSCFQEMSGLRDQQQVRHDTWVPISEAIARRANNCKQVIALAQSIVTLRANARLAELAWRMSQIDDYWAATAAIYASIRHSFGTKLPVVGESQRDPSAIIDRLRETILSNRVSYAADPHADMLPAIMIGALGLIGRTDEALQVMNEDECRAAMPCSTFAHLIPIIQAADRGSFEELEKLISLQWHRIRSGHVKQFAIEYLESVYCPREKLKDSGPKFEAKYDFRLTLAQLSLSADAVQFLSGRLPSREHRFRDDKKVINLLGEMSWLPSFSARADYRPQIPLPKRHQ